MEESTYNLEIEQKEKEGDYIFFTEDELETIRTTNLGLLSKELTTKLRAAIKEHRCTYYLCHVSNIKYNALYTYLKKMGKGIKFRHDEKVRKCIASYFRKMLELYKEIRLGETYVQKEEQKREMLTINESIMNLKKELKQDITTLLSSGTQERNAS